MTSQDLLGVISSLNSNKKKDKLDAFENLKALLNQEKILQNLYQNSNMKDKTLTWDMVFLRVHNAILTMIEETKQISDKNIQIMQNVIQLVVQRSINQKILLIDSNLIISSILAIFESNMRTKYLGAVYLDVFCKYVTTERRNWIEIKKENWIGMKNVCKKAISNSSSGIHYVVLLETLCFIVKNSSKCCQTSLAFLDLFDFIKDTLFSCKELGSNLEILLVHLTNLLCLQLAIEYRYKVCEFVEDVFDHIINLYRKNNAHLNTLVFHFLMTTLSVHNPNGVPEEDRSAYASNPQKWKYQIMKIFSICLEDIKEIIKNSNEIELDADWLNLFVDVSHLVSSYKIGSLSGTCEFKVSYDDPGPTNKRKCSDVEFNKSSNRAKFVKLDNELSVNLLESLQTTNNWFWLKFLEMIALKYPEEIQNDYTTIIQILCHILCERKDFNVKNSMRCLCAMVEAEKSLVLSSSDLQALNPVWITVGEESLRYYAIEPCQEIHILLQTLVKHSKPFDPSSLIKLFCNFGISDFSIENFRTLSVICQNCILPEVVLTGDSEYNNLNSKNVRRCLLSWLFNGIVKYPSEEFSKVLLTIILKKFENKIVNNVEKTSVLITRTSINEFFKLIANNYKSLAFKTFQIFKNSKSNDIKPLARIDSGLQNLLLELLYKRWYKLLPLLDDCQLSFNEQTEVVRNCYWLCEVVCYVLSHLEFMNISLLEDTSLLELTQTILQKCSLKTYSLLKVQFFDIRFLYNFYNARFHPKVHKIVRRPKYIHFNLLQLLFELFESREENKIVIQSNLGILSDSDFSRLITNSQSAFHIQNLADREKVCICATEILCQYISKSDSGELMDCQSNLASNILSNLLNDKCIKNCSNFHLQLVLRVVHAFSKFVEISSAVLNLCFELLSLIFNKKSRDSELILMIIQVCQDILPVVHQVKNAGVYQNYMKLVEDIRFIICIQMCCGVKTIIKFIEYLSEILKYDIEGKWAVSIRNNKYCKVSEDIITFLKHPCQEVRLVAAQHVGLLFTSNESTNESVMLWQEKMLQNVFDVLSETENFSNNDSRSVLEYEKYTTSSICLISWACIACHSSFWRRKALFYLIFFSHQKQIKKGRVAEIIHVLCNELQIHSSKQYFKYNIIYFFREWVQKQLELQDFPYYLLEYNTLGDFIQNHFQQLIQVYGEMGQFTQIEIISKKLNLPVSRILHISYPMLMAIILPSLGNVIHSDTSHKALKLKKFIDKNLLSVGDIQPFTDYLHVLIFHLIKNMHDPVYLTKLCSFSGNINDDKGSLNYCCVEVLKTLEYLFTKEGKSFLGKVMLKIPSMKQRVFNFLIKDIEEASLYEDKIFAFYKYIFFVETISTVTKNGLEYHDINCFIIRDVIYTLIAIMKKDGHNMLTDMACEGLRKLADAYLVEFSHLFGEFLPVITDILIPLAIGSNIKALNLLEFLICENYSKLEQHIELLDPFPSYKIFNKINEQIQAKQPLKKSLKNIIKNFIQTGYTTNSGCRIEGLKYLNKCLSERKDELKEMYNDLTKLRGFSEDCRDSVLHQLICSLVELTSNKNLDVKIEAGKCLGELGPSDLTTFVLRPEGVLIEFEESNSAIKSLFTMALNVLSDISLSDNHLVKNASSQALYAILSADEAKDLLQCTPGNFKNVEYYIPFLSSSKQKLQFAVEKDILIKNLNDKDLWKPNEHKTWIVSVVNGLLESLNDSMGIISSFIELIRVHWLFAENLFIHLLDIILSSAEKECINIIKKNFSTFFEYNFGYENKIPKGLDIRSVQCMINVVDHIRIQKYKKGISSGYCLDVNYLHFAKAALYCSAFFTSIFYAELWFHQKKKENHSCVDVNFLCEFFPEEGSVLAEILRECHSKIGNSDGIKGCGYMHVLNPLSEIQYYEHINNWNLSLLHHDIQLSMGNKEFEKGLIDSLERSGMFYILNNTKRINGLNNLSAEQYKCAAYLSDWSLINLSYKGSNDSVNFFDRNYYFALKAFNDDDDVTFLNEALNARKTILNELINCSLESSRNLYQPISELQSLKELEEFVPIVRDFNEPGLRALRNKWRKQDEIKYSEFRFVESILTKRTIFVKIALGKLGDCAIKKELQSLLCETFCKIIATSRKEKKFEAAVRALSHVSNLNYIPQDIFEQLKIEKARIFWERGDKEIGRFLLNHFIKKNEITGEIKAKGLRIYGDWMAKTKSESSREILQKYYLKSIEESKNTANLIDSYASLARFADRNYEQINMYLSSPLFEIKQSLINTQQDLASELRQELGWNQNREKRMAYQIAAKQSLIDENEIKNNKAERDSYLNLALKYYLLSLKEGEKYNLLVFRVVSMWLSNASSQSVIQQLKAMLHYIPTYKFLCLLPQLVPRMADVCLISDLIERILQDHPHHTLPLLFALKNSYEDLKYSGGKINVCAPRVQAAKSVLEKFQKHKKLKDFISEMSIFSNALIELANYSSPEKGPTGCPIAFPQILQINAICNLEKVVVPTLQVPIDKNCIYDKLTGIYRFDKNYYLVGGVNLPKKIKCIGLDGIGRSLLVKGKDDLRQDAVMQQVFTIMNSLLSHNADTKKRKLIVRTYKVVPLSQRSGIIEWCENTQPLSYYLTGPDGKSGAHKKFYPDDILAFECRCMIRKVFSQPQASNEDKLKVYLDICKRLHPVFHYFFIEKFSAAVIWFERRLAYIHSVATSSMIGYVLGIGDRHVQNILIDNLTAEVIHIDLGIAFDQGQTLPTPETVPFRLTRDIVDGMGSSGTEGDFRMSCIKTMEVLRDNEDTILTLLEVLLYDPLYTWTITPEKAYSVQGHAENNSLTAESSSPDLQTNKMAERALIRLKQKLQGTEAGCIATNVEGQVSYLIQQAGDPNNLCRLFHGWQAYL